MSERQEGQQNSQGCEGDDEVLHSQMPRILCSRSRSILIPIVVAGEPLQGVIPGSDQSTGDYPRVP